MRIGRLSQYLFPRYGACGCCRTTWNLVRHHTTVYRPGNGMFPLCEKCWSAMTPAARLPYYRELWQEWERSGHEGDLWPDIERAVLAGG